MMNLKDIREVEDLRGKRVLVRATLNVPIIGGKVGNDFRLRKTRPLVDYLRKEGAKVVLISHLSEDSGKSLRPVYEYFEKDGLDASFHPDCVGAEAISRTEGLKPGEVLILENLRMHEGEKANSQDFTHKLSKLGDIFVNNDFAVCHREHASVVSLPKLLPAYAGPLTINEVEHLSKVDNPERPFSLIIGGAKFDTKMPLIKKYLNIADRVFVGGALANDFFKAKGFDIGDSLVSGIDYDQGEMLKNEKLELPRDVTVRNADGVFVKTPNEVNKNDRILDLGTASIIQLKEITGNSKFIIWNGPVGDYKKGFRDSTIDLARAIVESSAESIVGGGDTFTVISKLGLEDDFSFMSTAGGAMLQFLSAGELPGLEPLKTG